MFAHFRNNSYFCAINDFINMKQTFISILMMLLPMLASAEAVEIDGIWYDLDADAKEAKVTSNPNNYSGDVVIPESVTKDGVQYDVTTIEESAFIACSKLTSITIGKSVKSIETLAFGGCEGLTAVHISDLKAWCEMVIESNPLTYARHLYLNGEEIKDLVIPSGVTSIGDKAFTYCDLTSVTFPSGVTSIGYQAFSHTKLTTVNFNADLTSIGSHAFYDCPKLVNVVIPGSVTQIGSNAFEGCNGLSFVVSLIEEPFEIGYLFDSAFPQEVYNNITLYVPVGTIDKYQSTEGWKRFKHIEEGPGPGGGTGMAGLQSDPVLVRSNGGVLSISGAPEGAEINVYNLSGQKVGCATATSNTADVFTSLQTGEVGIVEIGSTTVKVVAK